LGSNVYLCNVKRNKRTKMNTPMQLMFDQLKAARNDEYGLAFAIDMLLENEEIMLKKEKEVIVNAVKQGWDYNEEGLVQWMGETYYNETFNTEEK
jgi:hypothetical protein